MSGLTTCPDCGQKVSSKAEACPKCGREIRGSFGKRMFRRYMWFLLILSGGLIGACTLMLL